MSYYGPSTRTTLAWDSAIVCAGKRRTSKSARNAGPGRSPDAMRRRHSEANTPSDVELQGTATERQRRAKALAAERAGRPDVAAQLRE